MLFKRQEKILTEYVNQSGVRYAQDFYDDLPLTIRNSLERVKNQETLWCDAERFIRDLKLQQR